jgi:hypothetical protein
MNRRLLKRGLFNATVMLMLFAVAGLSTLAKNSQYFPKSNPTHYVNIASKMKVATSRVIVQRDRTSPVANVMPPKPFIPKKHTAEEEADLPCTSVGVSVSIQHRSPPSPFC